MFRWFIAGRGDLDKRFHVVIRIDFRALAMALSIALPSTQNAQATSHSCAEEVEGVCLKFVESPSPAAAITAPPSSPGAQREAALALSDKMRKEVQTGLRGAGLYEGPIDGVFGAETRVAIAKWQAAHNRPPDGYLAVEVLVALAINTGVNAPLPALEPINPFAVAEAVHGLQCEAEISGELAHLVFNRDGGVMASGREVAFNMDWVLAGRRLCIRNHGAAVNCVEISFGFAADEQTIRDHLKEHC